MLARVLSLIALTSSLFLLAAAAPGGHGNGGSNEVTQCDNGTVLCCDQAQDAKALDKSLTTLVQGIVGVDANNLQGLVGANCSPVNVVAGGTGGSCSVQQVCCQNNFNNGLVATGCTPISIAV
ncbi:hypothetical protein EST38_g5518 [Candolleomyces aberdarensis]|uniref:Hydrophobin n=1 Tax=Candolleomyces aberdarensis TaxID=2316362 RepID=A0A4Q2DLY8_9AGAR|nr:hypothetical protein EST38_g5518 [Candolleomyces aberdarensis]